MQNQFESHRGAVEKPRLLDRVIYASLVRRRLVLGAALLLFAAGVFMREGLSVDVFPDLSRPVVTVLAEAPGLAATEVESFVTIPLESALLGAPGVSGVRSSSKRGMTMARVEFEWGADIYRCRQIVSERVAAVRSELPPDSAPILGPVTSIMGEVLLIGLTAAAVDEAEVSPGDSSTAGAVSDSVSLREIRGFAEWTLRRRLLAVPGVSNVTVLGGEAKVYEIAVNAERLARANLGLLDLRDALLGAGADAGGGFFEREGREFAYRNLGSVYQLEELAAANVGIVAGVPISAKQVAVVRESALTPRGSAGVDGEVGVIVAVQKQPGASTLRVTETIARELTRLRREAEPRIQIHGELFRQADFIERSIENLIEALRDGSIIVAIVLLLFLWNLRTTAITLLALPLSLIGGVLALSACGFGINTMTLGGLAVAVGELVDDAIVDVENCFRRLRENRLRASPRPTLGVVYEASSEIRNSIVLATMVVVLVFVPLFFLDGVEGRLFRPLAVAYILAILSSLVVALTLTPVLCYYLLPGSSSQKHESALVRFLKLVQERHLRRIVERPVIPLAGAALLFMAALAALPFLDREFLPPFNEGTLTVEVIAASGTSLAASTAKAGLVEDILREQEGVVRVARRTGRAELDEHAEGVHYSEFDVGLDPGVRGAKRRRLIANLRAAFARIDDLAVGIGQPISHRLDHLLSGVRSEFAVMIYGREYDRLQYGAIRARELLQDVPGVVDLSAESAALAPEFKVAVDHAAAARYGLPVPRVIESLQAAQGGLILGRIREGERFVPVQLRLDAASRAPDAMANFVLRHLPDGTPVRVGDVADLYESEGPYEIQREAGERRIAVQFNSEGRSPGELAVAVQNKLEADLNLPAGLRFEIVGRYENAVAAGRRIFWLALAAFALVAIVLYANFRSAALTTQVLLNLPFSFVGGVFALWLLDVSLSVASMVGFVALAGIAARNGILMISHFEYIMRVEGASFSVDTIIRGALERLTPVLMTAGTAILALAPVLLSGADAPGKELLFPVALVITGGLFSSTLLDLSLTPVLYYQIARRIRIKNGFGVASEGEAGTGFEEAPK
ncbi:MAG: efflux RND transporter permease subunit [bacterium]|nr:efflux RND transporter permease subunit [bacterium]